MAQCLFCNKVLVRNKKYCSNRCQLDYQYKAYIKRWRNSEENGSRGISTKNISAYIYRYLQEKYKNGCSICGWNEINRVTGRIPLEMDHLDGNADNNTEQNLRMICPNCHSLTANFRNLNKGKGREWRKLKYVRQNKPT